MGDQLPAEGHIADVDGCCHLGHVPVHVEHAVGVAEVEVAVEDGDEDLLRSVPLDSRGGSGKWRHTLRHPRPRTQHSTIFLYTHPVSHLPRTPNIAWVGYVPLHRDPALDHNGDRDAQQHQISRDVKGCRKDHVFVVCCTLAWKLSDHPCIFVDTKGRTVLNRKVPVPLNGTTPVEEEQEDDQGKRDSAKDANDLDNQMLALIGHPAHPLARDALAREELDGRQSVVENQQADLDKPDGPQRTELHGEHHLAAINRPLRLQGREFGDVFCGHVVAAIFGRRVDADHVGREESLPDGAVSINWKIGWWGGGGGFLCLL